MARLLRRRALAGLDRVGDQPEGARRAGPRGRKAVRDQAAPPAQAGVGGDRVDEGTSWTWEQRSPGGRTIASHEVIADGGDAHRSGSGSTSGARSARCRQADARHDQALPRTRGEGAQGAQRAVTAWLDPLTSSGARQLLDALIDAFADGGIGDRSLREIAEAVGTSHRMLLHHFGSRDELLLAIVDEIERRQMAACPIRPPSPPTRWPPCGPTPQARAAAVRAALLRVLRPRRAGRAAVRPDGARRRRVLAGRGGREDRRDRRPGVRAARAGGHARPAARPGRHGRRRGRGRGRRRRSWSCCRPGTQTSAASLPASRST